MEKDEKVEGQEGQGDEKKEPQVEDLTDATLEEMPPVSEHVVSLEKKRSDRWQRDPGKTDGYGREFDPALHQVADGRPVLTRKGYIKCKPGKSPLGRPSSTKKKKEAKSKVVVPDPAEAERKLQAAQKAQEISAAAKTATELTFMLGQILGGPEWAPMGGTSDAPKLEVINERARLQSSYYDYFESRGVINLPPGLGLGLALLYYAVPRAAMPKTQTRLQRLGGWLRKKLVNLRLLKAKEDGPRADIRPSAEREDDASQVAEPEPQG